MDYYFEWDKDKNEKLKQERDVSFEEAVSVIENDGILETIDHPNQKKYPGQKIVFIKIEKYVYFVPFIVEGNKVFLKTIIPSRKATKKYLIKGGDKNEIL